MATAAEQGVITQVQLPSNELSMELPKSFILDLRGHRLRVDRDRLLSLPESILYSLSGGIVWDTTADKPAWSSGMGSRQEDKDNGLATEVDGEPLDVVAVDLNADLFEFVLNFFAEADHQLDPPTMSIEAFREDVETGLTEPTGDNEITAPVLDGELESFEARDHKEKEKIIMAQYEKEAHKVAKKTSTHHLPHLPHLPHFTHESQDENSSSSGNADPATDPKPQPSAKVTDTNIDTENYQVPEILQKRPSIISLREDLEYYCLLPPDFQQGKTPDESRATMENIKLKAGDLLTKSNHLFGGLKDKDKLDSPEYHLVQMLCLAGLDPDVTWNYRRREPCRTSIVSMQLLNIQTPEGTGAHDPSVAEALQKLLLFWRKPAKKCWWDRFDLDIPGECTIGIHARRVWTLEMSILGVE